MKKLLIFSSIIFFITGCTKLLEPTNHPVGWYSKNSENLHVKQIYTNIQFFVENPEKGNYSSRWLSALSSCQECHGDPNDRNNFHGGTSGVSCYQCHAGGPSGHPAFSIWVGLPDGANFHGKEDIKSCKSCHGQDLTGGIAEVSCFTCH